MLPNRVWMMKCAELVKNGFLQAHLWKPARRPLPSGGKAGVRGADGHMMVSTINVPVAGPSLRTGT
jgi:hypothetical protein